MMVCLLLYAYCVGVFSSRKIAQACERNLLLPAPPHVAMVPMDGLMVSCPGVMGWWLRDPWSSLAPNDLLSVSCISPEHPILHALVAPVKPRVSHSSS
jgi:hypothetical protein